MVLPSAMYTCVQHDSCHVPRLSEKVVLMPCRPLELRQPFIFYLGHLPAFSDARLAKVLHQQLKEPGCYADMFARGIDPDLDNPSNCEC